MQLNPNQNVQDQRKLNSAFIHCLFPNIDLKKTDNNDKQSP